MSMLSGVPKCKKNDESFETFHLTLKLQTHTHTVGYHFRLRSRCPLVDILLALS